MKNVLLCVSVSVVLSTALHADERVAVRRKPLYGVALMPACVIFLGAPVTFGTRLTLISSASQRRVFMTVGKATRSCGGDGHGDPGYELVGGVTGSDENGLSVAVVGRAPNDLEVRECTSNEGAHVFLKHRKSTAPFWHQYYYVGYDTEPSCSDEQLRWIKKLGP